MCLEVDSVGHIDDVGDWGSAAHCKYTAEVVHLGDTVGSHMFLTRTLKHFREVCRGSAAHGSSPP